VSSSPAAVWFLSAPALSGFLPHQFLCGYFWGHSLGQQELTVPKVLSGGTDSFAMVRGQQESWPVAAAVPRTERLFIWQPSVWRASFACSARCWPALRTAQAELLLAPSNSQLPSDQQPPTPALDLDCGLLQNEKDDSHFYKIAFWGP
jgi:hypothetical protein